MEAGSPVLYAPLNESESRVQLRKRASTFIFLAKVIYFCVGINGAAARSFLAIFLKDARMSYSYIGVYFAFTSAATALSTPLFGILIENVKMYSTFMRLLGILTVVASCTHANSVFCI